MFRGVFVFKLDTKYILDLFSTPFFSNILCEKTIV